MKLQKTPPILKRRQLARLIVGKLKRQRKKLAEQWLLTGPIRHFILDDLLPVVREIAKITELQGLSPDPNLYAGGISLMKQGDFLNPHLDNSHDKDRRLYRVLNLLYYVTPDWPEDRGGNLELWPNGPRSAQTEIWSRFNRLVVMLTNRYSWHSVSQVKTATPRCCVSNYYFSEFPADASSYFHVTSFRGRPEQPFRDLVLRGDIRLRMFIRKIFPKGIKENPHVYKR